MQFDTPDQHFDLLSDADEIVKKASANQIRKYRILETELHRVLHLAEDLSRVGDHTSIDDWIDDVNGRLKKWYDESQCFTRHNMLEFKHIQHRHLRARIHRPTPRLRSRTHADREIELEACQILIEDYVGQEHRRKLFYPWHGVHILFETALISLEACWSSRDWPLLREQTMQMLEVYLPQCLQVITNIGKRWIGATACADRLRPLVEKVRSALVQTNAMPFSMWDDTSITEQIQNLLFSDRHLIWKSDTLETDFFGLDEGSLAGNFPKVDDVDFFNWDPDSNIIPAESIGKDISVADPLQSSSRGTGNLVTTELICSTVVDEAQ